MYRLSSQANLRQNQTRLPKVVFKSPTERNLILQNEHELNGSGSAARRREAEKEQKFKLVAGEKDLTDLNF